MPKLFSQPLDGAKCAVCGFGIANASVIRYLAKHGADVIVSDKRMSKKEVQKKLDSEGLFDVKAYSYGDTPKCDYIFRTPGMRADGEVFAKSAQNGAVVTDEIRLFFENVKGKVIGITGSDGKTTTSSITYEILKNTFSEQTKRVFLGGNIGNPLADFIDKVETDDYIVAELSSFQLMYCDFSPSISAITNITENHLDWHKNMKEYVDSKCRIFERDGAEKLVLDSKTAERIDLKHRKTPENVVFTGIGPLDRGVFCKNGLIFKGSEFVMNVSDIQLEGEHNLKNYLTAIALTDRLADNYSVRKTATNFCGVEHRMTCFAKYKNVKFYDSSIDSTPSRTISTLSSVKSHITVIIGGYDKNLNYASLVKYLSENVSNIVLTGDSIDKILREIASIDYFGASITIEFDFEKAVESAIKLGLEDSKKFGSSSVVLSPACASFDRFCDYRERGNKFIEIVRKYIDNNC